MNISEVQSQPWSTLIADFYICQSCDRVYRVPILQICGTPCKHCGKTIRAQRVHFGLNALVLVNSIQDFYFLRHANPPPDPDGIADHVYTNKTDTRIVIPLLFCTLWDALTTELCQNVMRAKQLEEPLRERLLQDYRYSRDKRERLLPALTSEKWNFALAELTKPAELDYTQHFNFFLTINTKRNTFIHEGSHWHFTDEELERIPEELWPTFSLFAQLHNRYVPKMA
ncbi:hypothetical protein DO97_01320 [Neosynechococcus sphagnicola sy1]|uniref:Uncharacterized protein n=1 Tax=Neosynechococcus sphagnicola sy1 TaxID=1497020 RepID=A0A098TMT8_9CYAN|nr:hypothetical protein [Neosynechococcus sphagnicola]KGF73187.1 hypothetical protein DO97_01320 [Neosynechococcus sphagnicola sy1]